MSNRNVSPRVWNVAALSMLLTLGSLAAGCVAITFMAGTGGFG
jgi:hypothetical protein